MDETDIAVEPTTADQADLRAAEKKAKRARTRGVTDMKNRFPTRQGFQELKRQVPGWATSLTLHVAILLLLAFITLPLTAPPELSLRAARVVEETFEVEETLLEVNLDLEQETLEDSVDEQLETNPQVELSSETFETLDDLPLQEISEVIDFGAPISDLGEYYAADSGMDISGLAGRSGAGKASLLRSGGGTKSSEKAVRAGLDWLARHQYPDGSWNFDHRHSECNGRCGNQGSFVEARAAATGLALLCYLGAGHTHDNGSYQRIVYRGIYALGNMIKLDKNGGSFWDSKGRMYSQGIATMAICEAYALTGDPQLRAPAQAAINYVCYAQDPDGGGWRYTPHQPGDTSVMGWQIGALKSGYLSKLNVPSLTIERAAGFLDSAMVDGGARYLYVPDNDDNRPAVTAVGLLCRMYMGADHNDASIKAGIESLSKRGPSDADSYYNFYAAQVLFHFTAGKGPIWKKWNESTREMLVSKQVQEGHEAGSWAPAKSGDHGSTGGGRLYVTALSTMTLEVYYRMLPIYRKDAVAGEFEFQ